MIFYHSTNILVNLPSSKKVWALQGLSKEFSLLLVDTPNKIERFSETELQGFVGKIEIDWNMKLNSQNGKCFSCFVLCNLLLINFFQINVG